MMTICLVVMMIVIVIIVVIIVTIVIMIEFVRLKEPPCADQLRASPCSGKQGGTACLVFKSIVHSTKYIKHV